MQQMSESVRGFGDRLRPVAITRQEEAQDLFFGQVACVWARWSILLASAILVLWSSNETGELARRIAVILVLLGVNFFMHGRIMMGRPANRRLVTIATVMDLVVVTAFVAGFGAERGLANPYYVLAFPVLFAYSLVMPPRPVALMAAIAMVVYATVCLLHDPNLVGSTTDSKTLVMRLLSLGATTGLGAFFWRIQRARERDEQAQFGALANQT